MRSWVGNLRRRSEEGESARRHLSPIAMLIGVATLQAMLQERNGSRRRRRLPGRIRPQVRPIATFVTIVPCNYFAAGTGNAGAGADPVAGDEPGAGVEPGAGGGSGAVPFLTT